MIKCKQQRTTEKRFNNCITSDLTLIERAFFSSSQGYDEEDFFERLDHDNKAQQMAAKTMKMIWSTSSSVSGPATGPETGSVEQTGILFLSAFAKLRSFLEVRKLV